MTNQLHIDFEKGYTSRVAMENFVAPFLSELYANIIRALRIKPMSAPEINDLIHDDLDNVMSRLSELKNDLALIEVVEGKYYYRELSTRSGKKKNQPYRVYRIKI